MSNLALFGGPKTIGGEHDLRSTWAHKSLEQGLCEYTGAKYAKCVSSGTAAIISGLFAAGCGPGDEVITVAYTWVATAGSILRVNAVPIFADIDPRTFTIDPDDVRRKITKQTKAILAVDFYGHPAPIPELMEIAEERGLLVIEDACQASTAEINGVKVGNIAHVTAFSWSGKPIYSPGGGGAYLTNDRNLYERGLLAGQHPTVIQGLGTDPEILRYASMGGTGDNMRAVYTGEALQQLLDADVRTDARIRNCEYLSARLFETPGVTPPYVRPGYKHVYHIYNCLWDPSVHGVSRDRFCQALNAEGVYAVGYVKDANYRFAPESRPIEAGGPIHLRTIFQERNLYGKGCPFLCPHVVNPPVYREGDLPVSEELWQREFGIFQPDLSPPNDERDMDLIVAAVQKVVDHIDELKDDAP
ncbi:MAG: DegT/DnrJ/EryC1/StrS family aminotransferase [Armatimonadetes bacterium]|nr:DegT/DnrJ/EryC1/StrS family aminotransferase [Armatimonadota bacterium]